MASNYPDSLDDNASIVPAMDNVTEFDSEIINSIREAIFAIERTLGINPQGSASDLVSRLGSVLNDDGTFKSSALTSSGLIALPITNAMVGASAAIEESKLDLDIPTQSLQNQVSSNDTDIASLQTQYNYIVTRFGNHAGGVAENHDGYDIVLVPGLFSAPNVTTVGQALDFIYEQFLLHKSFDSVNQHAASSIAYTPQSGSVITATNVQGAIGQSDSAFREDRRKHLDSAHSNAVSSDGYVVYNGSAAVNDASARLSRFNPSSGADAIKVGQINAAVIKTRGLSLSDISASANSIDFQVRIGSTARTISITGLNSAAYPATNSRLRLKALVDSFNAQFANATQHFPLQAYETADGEIAIQHNIVRNDCTIMVKAPALNSAIFALGLSAIIDVEIGPVSNYYLHVDGYQFSDLRTTASGSLTHSVSSSVVNLGQIVGSPGLELRPGQLFHVFSHSSTAANGTYAITSVAPYPATQININTSLTAGTFNYIIYDDVAAYGTSSNPRSLDISIDNQQRISTQIRYESTINAITGISVVAVSRDFANLTGLLTLALSGSTYSLYLTLGTAGPITQFSAGYIGYLKVYAPNNTSYITVLVSSLAPTIGSNIVTISSAQIADEYFFLGSTFYDSVNTIEIPLDSRNVGSVGLSAMGTEVTDGLIGKDISNTIGNGFIRGFDLSNSSTTITVQGGSAYVNGRLFTKETDTLNVLNIANADGTWSLVLTDQGNITAFSDAMVGYEPAKVLLEPSVLLIARFIVSGGAITSVTDARIAIDTIARKMPYIVDESSFMAGTFRSLSAAQLYSTNVSSAKNIEVISDITISSSFTVAAERQIRVRGDLAITGSLSILSSAELIVDGYCTVSGALSIGNNATLSCLGGINITGATTISNRGVCRLGGSSTVLSISLGGDGVLEGLVEDSEITFSGSSATGITAASGSKIRNLTIQYGDIATATNISATAGGVTISNCFLLQDIAVDESKWAGARYGVALSGSDNKVVDCEFYNLGKAISGTFSNSRVTGCKITNIGTAIETITSCGNSIFADNFISLVKTNAIKLDGADGCTVANNLIDSESSTSTALTVFSISGSSQNTIFKDNVVKNVDITSSSGNLFSTFTGLPGGIQIIGNVFANCTYSDASTYAITLNSDNNALFFSNNTVVGHTGAILSIANGTVCNNSILVSTAGAGTNGILIDSCVAEGNRIELPPTHVANITTSIFLGNKIRAGSFSIIGDSALESLIVSNNEFTTLNSSTSNGVSLTLSGSSGIHVFSNNHIDSTANQAALYSYLDGTNRAELLISDNIINRFTSSYGIYLDGLSATGLYPTLLSGNKVSCGTGVTYGIYINRDNVSVIGNEVSDVAGSITAAAIFASTNTRALFIDGNVVGAGSTPGRTISHGSATPTDVIIGINKNAIANITYSFLGSTIRNSTTSLNVTDTTWLYDDGLDVLQALNASGAISTPLLGLPVGAKLTSVTVYAQTANNNAFSASLKRRAAGVSSSTIISPLDSGVNGSISLLLTPSPTHYILNNNEYFVEIDMNSSNTDTRLGCLVIAVQY